MNRFYLKKALRIALMLLLLAVVGRVNAQYYNYEPDINVYTESGSGTTEMNKFNYSNCAFLSTYINYSKGHVNTCLTSHNTSSGLMKFRIAKCDNNYYYGNGSSGKIIIVENNSTVVLCEQYTISNSSTHYITKSFYHDNFTGTCFFDVYLITSDLVNYFYAGRVVVRRANKPTVSTLTYVDNIMTNSAWVNGTVNPQGLNTTWYFQYGTSSSFGNTTEEHYIEASYSTGSYGQQLSGLQSGTTYYYRICAYNDAGTSYGSTLTFTTEEEDTSAPEVTTDDADNITAYSARLKAHVNPRGLSTTAWFEYGTTTSLGTTTSTISLDNSYNNYSITKVINNLEPNTKYYYRAYASNSKGQTQGARNYFYTDAGGNPIVTTGNASAITTTSATVNGTINPQGLTTTYYFRYGTTNNYELGHTVQGTLGAYTSNLSVSADLSGLTPNTSYHYQLYASNNYGTQYGEDKTFTTSEDLCYFTDCTSSEVQTAAHFLCERGVVTGDDGTHTLRPNDAITRGELVKAAFYGLYSNSNGVSIPNPLVTDYFPCIYPDLQNQDAYYYRAARALLYLEYGDGIAPFDRNRGCFYPNETISRRLVLKVLLETFNIAPATGGYNPFTDFPSTENFWGYAKKAYDLGITTTSEFRPTDECTRGEAFLFLYRILQLIDNNGISAPNPQNYENPELSSFFIPANLSPEVVNAIRGVEYGNFNYYEKDFFNIPGYMNLDFGISYNSYLTEMPDDFYPVKPMGKAWKHNYDMYMNIIEDPYNNTSYYVFHMQNGLLLIYKANLEKLTEGNYYDLTRVNTNKYTLKSREQMLYTFQRNSTSETVFTLREIRDRNDNVITLSYSGQQLQSVTTMGRVLNFEYNGSNMLFKVTDPSGRYVRFYYNSEGQLTSLKDAKNQTTYFSYGVLDIDKGLLQEIQLPNGNYVYNNYEQRKLKSMTRVANNDDHIHTTVNITNDYEHGGQRSVVTTTKGNDPSVSTTYQMNDKGRVTNINDGCHTNMSFEYGNANYPDLVSSSTNEKTNIQTSYAYTSKGLPASVTITDGSTTIQQRVVYNDMNDIVEFYDANNNKTTYTYNSNGNMTSVTDALNHQTNIVYNSHGAPTRVTNPMGIYVDYDYNSYGNLETISIPVLGQTSSISYDEVSRVVSKTDVAGKTVSYTYDDNDNVCIVTDPLGNTSTYSYDANDNLTRITNAKGNYTDMAYDNNDFLTSVSAGNYTRSYTYNRDGSLKTFTDPNGHTFSYSYNNSGELTGDGTSTLTYKSNGRLWKATRDGKAITYDYDAFGRASSISYDGNTVSYTYDNNGNVKTITYPGSKTVTYTYDALNRIRYVKDWNNNTTLYNFRDDGQLDFYQYPNGVRTTYSYDNAGRCNGFSTKRDNGSGTVIAEYSFEFDAVGNHTSETFTEPYGAYPSIPTEDITYATNANNRLISAGGLSFTYDNNGNTLTRTGRTYNYDYLNNLTSVSGDFTASYAYDGLGNRCSATRNGVTTKYVHNLLPEIPTVLMETDANGNVLNYYIYGAAGLISRIDANNNTSYYVYDFRGSTVAMIDNSANITHKYQYDEFGKVLQSQEADLNRFRYVGKYGVMYEDDALTFIRARYYDPEIGRFLSEDPIWNSNLYPYAANNPVMGIDPNGEFCITAALAIAGAIVTIVGIVDNIIHERQPLPDLVNDKNEIDVRATVGFVSDFILSPVGNIVGGVGKAGSFIHKAASAVSNTIGVGTFATSVTNTTLTVVDRKQEKRQLEQQNAAQITKKSVCQSDPEALRWMLSSSDSYAKALKSRWENIDFQDVSEAQKNAVRAGLVKCARTYMNNN